MKKIFAVMAILLMAMGSASAANNSKKSSCKDTGKCQKCCTQKTTQVQRNYSGKTAAKKTKGIKVGGSIETRVNFRK